MIAKSNAELQRTAMAQASQQTKANNAILNNMSNVINNTVQSVGGGGGGAQPGAPVDPYTAALVNGEIS